ncbi:hypothetical protein HOLleu_25125 [Holothuria leucospilota]|uniref:Uncharacterized protein n=1 Tax=Holothuria leucospilota TaxID=206669 RepID=A0A9Q1BSD9_HOLLE|nr:hypothetical protein HOLleu_25125 [Holothuria leucospilota]
MKFIFSLFLFFIKYSVVLRKEATKVLTLKWTGSDWIVAWATGSLVPVEDCNTLSVQQLFEYACLNDFYYDAETAAGGSSGSGEDRRRRHIGTP